MNTKKLFQSCGNVAANFSCLPLRNNRKLLVSVALLAITIIYPNFLQSQVPSRYNVLFVAIDDMNDRVSFLGWPEVVSPNLGRLLNRGMLFTRAYTQYPLCNPSRASFLSGWRPDKTGIFDNITRPRNVLGANLKFLPEYFKQNGYRIERYGKILHNPFENDINWDYAEPPQAVLAAVVPAAAPLPAPPGVYWVRNIADSFTHDGSVAKNLVKRLKQPQTQPFFYGLGLLGPHDFFIPNLKYWNFNGDPSVQELLPVDSSGNTRSDFKGNGSSNIILPSTPPGDRNDVPSAAFTPIQLIKPTYEWQRTIHAYDAEVAQMDAQLGLVLDELDRQNLWSNTIVVFFGDHGQHLGEHEGLWQKLTLFEESLHVPFIICAPGKKVGVCTKLVELVDLYPTLLELCALPPVQGLEGTSLARLLDDPTRPWKTAAFSQVLRKGVMARSVCTEQYRYTSWGPNGEELYDHNVDPHEYTNLVANPTYNGVLKKMRKLLSQGWTKAVPPGPSFAVNSNISVAESISALTLSAYPSPTTGSVTVVYNSKMAGQITMRVLDATGKALFKKTGPVIKGNNTFNINLHQLVSGIYYLELYNNAEQKIIKLVVMK